MTTAVLRTADIEDLLVEFAQLRPAPDVTEVRIEIAAGSYDRCPATLSVAPPIRTLTVIAVGGAAVFHKCRTSFEATEVNLRGLVFDNPVGSRPPVYIEAERIDVDGLAVIASSRRASGRRPFGEITLNAKGTATASLKRIWIVGNDGGGTPGLGVRGGVSNRFDSVVIADSVFGGNQTGHGIVVDSAANLRVSNTIVLEPTLTSGWLSLADPRTRTEITGSLLGVPAKLVSYWRSVDLAPDDYQRPVVSSSEFRGGGKGERIETQDVSHGAAITDVDTDALLAAARRLDTPDRAVLARTAR